MKTRLALVFLAGCGPSSAELARAYDAAINAKDVEKAAAMFAPSAVLEAGGKEVRGTAEIKAHLASLVAQNAMLTPVGAVTEKELSVVWQHQIVTDEYTKLGVGPLVADNRMTFVGGTITAGYWHLTPESQQKLDALAGAELTKRLDAYLAVLNAGKVAETVALMTEDGSLHVGEEVLNGPEELMVGLKTLADQHLVITVQGAKAESLGGHVKGNAKVMNQAFKDVGVASMDAELEASFVDDKVRTLYLTFSPASVEALTKAVEAAQAAPPPKKGKRR